MKRLMMEIKMNNSDKLFLYLNEKLQNSIAFEDLFNLFFSLYCTISILPKNMQSFEMTKEVLAEVFAKITREKYKLGYHFDNMKDANVNINPLIDEFWISLISEYLKNGILPNLLNAEALLSSSKN